MPKPRAEKASQKPDKEQREIEAMMRVMLEDLLTVQEAASLMGTTAGRVRQLVIAEKIAAIKKGNLLIVHRKSVVAHMKTRRTGRPPRVKKLVLDKV